MVTPPAPTDGAPEAPHPAPFEQGTQETLQVGKQTALIAAMVIARARQQTRMPDLRKAVDRVRDLMRRIREVFANGRLNLQKFRENLSRRRTKGRASGPQNSAEEPRREQTRGGSEQAGPEQTSQKDEGRKKQESTGPRSSLDEPQVSEMVRVLSSRLDADGAMALWGLAVQEKGKFADKVAEIAEGRLREIDPELMKSFDGAREQGKGRLEAMSDSLSSHPRVGEDFTEALKSMDEKNQAHKAELQEAKLANAVEDLQADQKFKSGPPLSSSELKEHFENNPHPTSGPYPNELLDKVTDEKYRPSKGVEHAQNILRAEESERKNADQKSSNKKSEKEQNRQENPEKGKNNNKNRGQDGEKREGKENNKRRRNGRGGNNKGQNRPQPRSSNKGNGERPEHKKRNNNNQGRGRRR